MKCTCVNMIILQPKENMVYQSIDFYLGYLYTLEELVELEIVGRDDEDDPYEIDPEYEDNVHTWPCCSPLSRKMYVVGRSISSTQRKWGYSCGECHLSNHTKERWDQEVNEDEEKDEKFRDDLVGLCDECKTNWLNHKGGHSSLPKWCKKCIDKWDKSSKKLYLKLKLGETPVMQCLTVCDKCIGICVNGSFDVNKMMEEPVFFDGFPAYKVPKNPGVVFNPITGYLQEPKFEWNRKTPLRDCLCHNCNLPSVQVAWDAPCPHCEFPQAFRDEYPRSYDNSFIGRIEYKVSDRVWDIENEFGKGKELHIIAIPDDCLSCS